MLIKYLPQKASSSEFKEEEQLTIADNIVFHMAVGIIVEARKRI